MAKKKVKKNSKKLKKTNGSVGGKKYDGEFPKKYYKEFLDFCSIDDDDFTKIIDSWRSEHIWTKDKEGKWILKTPIWN